jgi:hypothetical protein
MVEPQPSKLAMPVRSRSPAPIEATGQARTSRPGCCCTTPLPAVSCISRATSSGHVLALRSGRIHHSSSLVDGEGGQCYFGHSSPLLSHSHARDDAWQVSRAVSEPHDVVDSHLESKPATHLTHSLAQAGSCCHPTSSHLFDGRHRFSIQHADVPLDGAPAAHHVDGVGVASALFALAAHERDSSFSVLPAQGHWFAFSHRPEDSAGSALALRTTRQYWGKIHSCAEPCGRFLWHRCC